MSSPQQSYPSGTQRPRKPSKESIPHLREPLSSLVRKELDYNKPYASSRQWLRCLSKAYDGFDLNVNSLSLLGRCRCQCGQISQLAPTTRSRRPDVNYGRSKSCPLNITINFSPREEHSGVTENIIHAMDLVRPALWRTKSFRCPQSTSGSRGPSALPRRRTTP
jgi:hypothetical protein